MITNAIMTAFMTAQAGIKLYELKEVQTTAYYVDTDTIIYCCPANIKPLPTNDWLGGLTDECLSYKEGSYTTEFIGAARKVTHIKLPSVVTQMMLLRFAK